MRVNSPIPTRNSRRTTLRHNKLASEPT
jgi:hypothetical protein